MAKKRANGEGNIRKRADGRWEGRYTAGYHPETGKRIIKNVLGKTQAECKAKLKKAIEESQALDVGRADEYTVAAWLRTWFELYSKLHIRPSTMNYYHRNIEQHIIPAIGDIPLNKLTTRDLQKFYNDLQSNGRLPKNLVFHQYKCCQNIFLIVALFEQLILHYIIWPICSEIGRASCRERV